MKEVRSSVLAQTVWCSCCMVIGTVAQVVRNLGL
jgi:hypothetical protein